MNSLAEWFELMGKVVTIGTKVGASSKFWELLSRDEGNFRKFVGSMPIFQLSSAFDHDKREDWRLEENPQEAKEGEFGFELVSVFGKDEGAITGPEFEVRAKAQQGLADQLHLEAMVRNGIRIPPEYEKLKLVGPETVWTDPRGPRYMPFLRQHDFSWILDFLWLGSENQVTPDFQLVRIL